MAVPSGFELPSPGYLAVLLAGVGLAGYGLSRRRPPATDRTVLALAPWMVVGSSLYVSYQVGLVPAPLAPFAGSPAVYLTTVVAAAAAWLAADRLAADPLRALAAAGGLAVLVPVGAVLAYGARAGTLRLWWPAVGLVVGLAVAGAAWVGVRRVAPETAAATGAAGALTVLGHALDGVSTAVGVDALGFGEQTPLSRAILEVAAGLPTAAAIGQGWLFVLVKLALALVVVHLFGDYVREEPGEGYALLGLVAAVGLGPGAHNLLLYVVARPGF